MCVCDPVLLLALHSSHHPSSGLVSVSGEPGMGGGWGKTGEKERKRRREERRRRGVLVTGEGGGGEGGCLHGQMDCSFSTHVEPCFVFHCRQAGAESIALLARTALSYCTPLFSSACPRARKRAHTHICKSVYVCSRATQTSPSLPAHMLKSSPLLTASKTQHPRLLCCCQVLPLADATGESYPSEVALPRERQAPRYFQPPLM